MITKTVMAITAPLSYPISRILDAILGEEIGNVFNRERLKELVRVSRKIHFMFYYPKRIHIYKFFFRSPTMSMI